VTHQGREIPLARSLLDRHHGRVATVSQRHGVVVAVVVNGFYLEGLQDCVRAVHFFLLEVPLCDQPGGASPTLAVLDATRPGGQLQNPTHPVGSVDVTTHRASQHPLVLANPVGSDGAVVVLVAVVVLGEDLSPGTFVETTKESVNDSEGLIVLLGGVEESLAPTPAVCGSHVAVSDVHLHVDHFVDQSQEKLMVGLAVVELDDLPTELDHMGRTVRSAVHQAGAVGPAHLVADLQGEVVISRARQCVIEDEEVDRVVELVQVALHV
jgi:hypothetical protein